MTGDEELGRHTRLRQALRERGARYVLGVPCNTIIRDLKAPLPAYQGRGRRPKAPWHLVSAWRHTLDPDGWTQVTVRDGEKGPAEIELVTRRVQTRLERKRTGPHEWLVVTRHPLADEGACAGKSSPDARDQDTCYGYRYYLTPTGMAKGNLEEPSLMELARIITAGLCIEASFKRGKGEVGMDEYQVRTWEGWHHHMVLTLIAVWFLISETHRGQQWTPKEVTPRHTVGLEKHTKTVQKRAFRRLISRAMPDIRSVARAIWSRQWAMIAGLVGSMAPSGAGPTAPDARSQRPVASGSQRTGARRAARRGDGSNCWATHSKFTWACAA